MGILALHDYIIGASYKEKLSNIKPTDIAIDASIWICQFNRENPEQSMKLFMERLNRWREFGHKLIVVFDGDELPGKKHARDKREASKLKRIQKLYNEDKHDEAEKLEKALSRTKGSYQKAIIKELREQKFDYIVAPYEADSQLAYLTKIGTVEYVITEDTDLALLCDKVIFKFNTAEGSCRIFQKIYLKTWLEELIGKHNDNFDNTFMMFSILLGCDYVPNIPKLGPMTLKKVLKENPQIKSILDLINSPILKEQKITVTDDYLEKYQMAETIFKHAYAYDPFQRKRLPLNPYPENFDPYKHLYLGNPMPSVKRAKRHALGEDFLDAFDPTTAGYDETSIWIRQYPVPIKNISCPWCGLFFESIELLAPHYTTHLERRPLECRIIGCDYLPINEDDNAMHFAAYHSKKVKDKKCPICHKIIQDSLEIHQRIRHQKKAMVTCVICQLGLVSEKNKKIHMKTQHPNGEKLYCEICKYQFTCLKLYCTHLKRHQSEPKYQCPKEDCNAKFLTKAELNHHTRYHDNTPKTCQICKAEFAKIYTLQSHKYYHTSGLVECLTCKEQNKSEKGRVNKVKLHVYVKHKSAKICSRDGCNIEFKDGKSYEKHIEDKHLTRYYHCYFPSCKKKFKTQQEFQEHDIGHYMDPTVTFPEALIVNKVTKTSKVQCPKCKKMLTKDYFNSRHKCKKQVSPATKRIIRNIYKKTTCPDCGLQMTIPNIQKSVQWQKKHKIEKVTNSIIHTYCCISNLMLLF